jgi:hypothetical protein
VVYFVAVLVSQTRRIQNDGSVTGEYWEGSGRDVKKGTAQ